ncbi:class I SAM-dependent methyltransferase [Methanobacterium sp.]|uniref:class I SAM-dependent methyltransferase n=1 Tax=Methanobacterium sp. TaxID=2164 RepID=UPI00315834F6
MKAVPAEVLKNLDIHNGDIIGDVGTGGGYFTFEFSKKVGKKGRVYAIDINQKSLAFIDDKSKKEMINNIKAVLTSEKGFLLPETVDMLFLRNVFHHLPEPVEYFKNIKQFLKKDGKVVIMDYKQGQSSFVGIFGHYTPEKTVIDTMKKAGFDVSKKFDFLPKQSFIIFKNKFH